MTPADNLTVYGLAAQGPLEERQVSHSWQKTLE